MRDDRPTSPNRGPLHRHVDDAAFSDGGSSRPGSPATARVRGRPCSWRDGPDREGLGTWSTTPDAPGAPSCTRSCSISTATRSSYRCRARGAVQAENSGGRVNWTPPCPPSGGAATGSPSRPRSDELADGASLEKALDAIRVAAVERGRLVAPTALTLASRLRSGRRAPRVHGVQPEPADGDPPRGGPPTRARDRQIYDDHCSSRPAPPASTWRRASSPPVHGVDGDSTPPSRKNGTSKIPSPASSSRLVVAPCTRLSWFCTHATRAYRLRHPHVGQRDVARPMRRSAPGCEVGQHRPLLLDPADQPSGGQVDRAEPLDRSRRGCRRRPRGSPSGVKAALPPPPRSRRAPTLVAGATRRLRVRRSRIRSSITYGPS